MTTLAENECLIDAARDWLADARRHRPLLRGAGRGARPLSRRLLAAGRRRRRGSAEGRVFVDKHGFNIFKLPLIARLFPEARILCRAPRPARHRAQLLRHRFR